MRTNIEIDDELLSQAMAVAGASTKRDPDQQPQPFFHGGCIERGYALLHSDRDFEPMEKFLGLKTA